MIVLERNPKATLLHITYIGTRKIRKVDEISVKHYECPMQMRRNEQYQSE